MGRASHDLDKLPGELRPSNLCTVTKGNITAFFTSHSKLSNHYHCTFSVNGLTFSSVEQHLMYQKGNHFGDNELAMKILENDDPVSAKSMGTRVQYFKSDEWNSVKDQYMRTGITAKFQQNEELANFLITPF